jgi:hypothetical protein
MPHTPASRKASWSPRAAHDPGRIEAAERVRRAAPERAALRRQARIRRFLGVLFTPNAVFLVPGDDPTVVCRCDEGPALGGPPPAIESATRRDSIGSTSVIMARGKCFA